MSKITDKVWGNINYNTYLIIKNSCSIIFPISALGSCVSKNDVCFLFNNLFFCLYSYLMVGKIENKTKDVNEVKRLYDIFIENYNELNKMFELENPLEIFNLFNNLLYNGYLSKNKVFNSSGEDVRDINIISGANINMGIGVCRHISAMLTDILNNYGIESDNLIGILKLLPADIIFKNFIKSMSDIYNPSIDYNLSDNIPTPKGHANHMITCAKQGDYYYFLDGMQKMTYHISDSDNKILINDYVVMKMKDRKYKINKYTEGLIALSIDEEEKIFNKTDMIFEQNKDVFEKFYDNNKEIYEDITDKMLRMSKRN